MKSTDFRPANGIPEGITLEDRDIPELPTLIVNQLGHIRGILCKHGMTKKWLPRGIQFDENNGMWKYEYSLGKDKDGKKRKMTPYVGNLVALAFLGPLPKDHKLCYLDGDKTNHCLWNLAYLPLKEAVERGFIMAPEEMTRRMVIGRRKQRAERAALKAQPEKKPRPAPKIEPREREQVMEELHAGRTLEDVWLERFQSRMVLNTFLRMMKP